MQHAVNAAAERKLWPHENRAAELDLTADNVFHATATAGDASKQQANQELEESEASSQSEGQDPVFAPLDTRTSTTQRLPSPIWMLKARNGFTEGTPTLLDLLHSHQNSSTHPITLHKHGSSPVAGDSFQRGDGVYLTPAGEAKGGLRRLHLETSARTLGADLEELLAGTVLSGCCK
jgi:hypothetical protein